MFLKGKLYHADLVRKIHRLIHSSAINFEDIPYEDW